MKELRYTELMSHVRDGIVTPETLVEELGMPRHTASRMLSRLRGAEYLDQLSLGITADEIYRVSRPGMNGSGLEELGSESWEL